jgi:hypothetical protein
VSMVDIVGQIILLQLLKCISSVDWNIPYDVSFRP